MTDGRIGGGIIATGGIAAEFAGDLAAAGLRLAAVGSRTQQRADAFAAEHGVPHAHGSWQALVDDPSVDVVYVATPHPAHATAALLALRASKHVLVEKPFTLNATEAAEVVAEAEQRSLVVLEAMWTRFLPHMLEVRAALAAGEIGDPQVLEVGHKQLLPTDPGHRLNAPELGGGALLDLGVYPISLAVDLFGLPVTTLATAEFGATGVDRRISTVHVHDGGRHTLTVSALDLPGPNRAVITGTEGTIEIESSWLAPSGYLVRDGRDRVIRTSRPVVSGRGRQYQAFEVERLIREGGTSERMPPAQSVAIMAVLDGIRAQIGLRYPGEATPGR